MLNVVLTNEGLSPTLLSSEQAGGWLDVLDPGDPYSLAMTGITVAIIGDKPGVIDTIKAGLTVIVNAVKRVLEELVKRRDAQGDPAPTALNITVLNRGSNAVRVILGDGVSDWDVQPQASYRARASGYIELRELGLVEQGSNDPAAPDAP